MQSLTSERRPKENVEGFKRGILDIPFAPTYTMNKVLPARDNGAVRYLDFGNIPLLKK